MIWKNDMCDKPNKEITQIRIDIKVLETRLAASENNLILQATEYHRRLDDLNGEADRLKSMQASYLPREVYESKHKEVLGKVESIEKIVHIGIGIMLCLQVILHFFK